MSSAICAMFVIAIGKIWSKGPVSLNWEVDDFKWYYKEGIESQQMM